MPQESCNINNKKDEAEILKSSSPSASPPPAAAAAAAPSPSTLFLSSRSPPKRVPFQRPEEKEEEEVEAEQPKGQETQDPRVVASKPLVKILSRKEENVQPSACRATAINRCSRCHKKVGLTGFQCRCGKLFCGRHRYSDVHDCSFDYKTAAREAISKANPIVRAAKIIKI